MKEYRFMTKLLKRSLSLFLVLAFILSGVCAIASDIVFNDIKIMIDGQMLDAKDAQGNKVEPFIIDGTTYLPVRAVSEAFSLKVEYDEKTKTAYIGSITNRETDTGDTFKIYVNGVKLDPKDANGKSVPPVNYNGSLYVPVRAISEALSKEVSWDDSTKTVIIKSKESKDLLTEDPLGNKYYLIINKGTGKALAVKGGSKDNNGEIVVEAQNKENPAQIWGLGVAGDSVYRLTNKNSGKSADVPAQSTDVGIALIQYTPNGGLNQSFLFTQNADGTYTLTAMHSKLVLDVQNDIVIQTSQTNSDTQKWELVYVGDSIMRSVLTSPGFLALDENYQRAFKAYLYQPVGYSQRVQTTVEGLLLSKDYENLSAEEQKQILIESLKTVPYDMVTGDVTKKVNAKYTTGEKYKIENFDIWRGDRRTVWAVDVEMEGNGTETHKFTVYSEVENTPVIQRMIDTMAVFPYGVRKFVKSFIYKPDPANNYNGSNNTIWIRTNYEPPLSQMIQTTAHELGHVVDFSTGMDSRWNRAISNDIVPVSGYGNTNRYEDLAEFSRLYWISQGNENMEKAMEIIYPNRYREFVNMLHRADPSFPAYDKNPEPIGVGKEEVDMTRYYTIVNKDNLALTVKDGKLVLSSLNNSDEQKWEISPAGDGWFDLVNKKTKSSITVPDLLYSQAGDPVSMGTGAGDRGQWAFIKNGDTFILRNRFSGFALEATDLKVSHNFLSYTKDIQQFKLVKTDDQTSSKLYKITLKSTGEILGLDDSKALVAKQNDNQESSIWILRQLDGGYYNIINLETFKYLDVSGNSAQPGATIITYQQTGGDNQAFSIEKNADGTVSFKAKHSGLYITVKGGIITQENLTNENNQKFVLEEAN